jgi:hypothetical protein
MCDEPDVLTEASGMCGVVDGVYRLGLYGYRSRLQVQEYFRLVCQLRTSAQGELLFEARMPRAAFHPRTPSLAS